MVQKLEWLLSQGFPTQGKKQVRAENMCTAFYNCKNANFEAEFAKKNQRHSTGECDATES